MHETLHDYVARIAALAATDLPPATRVERARGALAALLLARPELAAPQRTLPAEGYGRHLLHKDEDHGFVVLAMTWPPGFEGKPHDHRTWGVIGVLEGELAITGYDTDDGLRLRERDTARLAPGQTGFVLPPHDDHHRVCNPGPEMAISLHTYGTEITTCRIFEGEDESFEVRAPAYDSVPSE